MNETDDNFSFKNVVIEDEPEFHFLGYAYEPELILSEKGLIFSEESM